MSLSSENSFHIVHVVLCVFAVYEMKRLEFENIFYGKGDEGRTEQDFVTSLCT